MKAVSLNTQVVETAAPKGVGLAELEEAVLLQAEVMDLKASRSGRAEATVVEARRDKGQGPIATLIVKRGCLQVCICSCPSTLHVSAVLSVIVFLCLCLWLCLTLVARTLLFQTTMGCDQSSCSSNLLAQGP